MEITAELVKQLRDKTNCGFMDCKKALQETQGDLEAAVTYLRQKGIAVASKRAERATSEGAVWSYIGPDAKTGVLLEVNCESDFVAKTEAFLAFGESLATQIAQTAPADLEGLLAQPWQSQDGVTVQDFLTEIITNLPVLDERLVSFGEPAASQQIQQQEGFVVSHFLSDAIGWHDS